MTEQIKCECGVELFNRDVVLSVEDTKHNPIETIYRCPKCFETTTVQR